MAGVDVEDDIDEFWIRFFLSGEQFVANLDVDKENADHGGMRFMMTIRAASRVHSGGSVCHPRLPRFVHILLIRFAQDLCRLKKSVESILRGIFWLAESPPSFKLINLFPALQDMCESSGSS